MIGLLFSVSIERGKIPFHYNFDFDFYKAQQYLIVLLRLFLFIQIFKERSCCKLALFRIFKGNSANLPVEMHDGYCYFTTDDGQFYIDYLEDPNDATSLRRRPISGPGRSIEYIVGTQTESTRYWTGDTKDAQLTAGKVIAYKLPYAGTSSASFLELTLANGVTTTGRINVYLNNNTGVTTHFPAGTVILLTYDGSAWKTFDYNTNTNTLVRTFASTTDVELPLIAGSTANSATAAAPTHTSSYKDLYGALPATIANRPTLNPSTGVITATKFKGPLEGNADTATEFSTNADITLTGDVSGSVSSTKDWSIATTLAASGVTAGSYGPSTNATPTYGATFNVPYITVDAKGRITAASTKTVTIPTSDNTNTTYTISGAYGSSDTTWVNTLTPSSGSATTSTVPNMVGASSSTAGKAGLVAKPAAGDNTKFLRGDATWQSATLVTLKTWTASS